MSENTTRSRGCLPNTFGYRLRKLRRDKNLNQDDLANALGVSRSTLGKYETNDRFPSQKKLRQIAQYFNVSMDFLLIGDNEYDIESLFNGCDAIIHYKGKPIDEVKRFAIKQILELPSFDDYDD